MFKTAASWWYKWAYKNNKAYTNSDIKLLEKRLYPRNFLIRKLIIKKLIFGQIQKSQKKFFKV